MTPLTNNEYDDCVYGVWSNCGWGVMYFKEGKRVAFDPEIRDLKDVITIYKNRDYILSLPLMNSKKLTMLVLRWAVFEYFTHPLYWKWWIKFKLRKNGSFRVKILKIMEGEKNDKR